MHKISDGFIHLIVRWIFLSKMLDVRKDASRHVYVDSTKPDEKIYKKSNYYYYFLRTLFMLEKGTSVLKTLALTCFV